MRININLATERYEAAHRFQQRMRSLVALMAVVALLLVGYIVYQRKHTRDIDRKIAQARHELDELSNEKMQAQVILAKPANREIADQAQFLNELFARKSLSWTRIFSEMERIMPYNIHVVSIKPDYTNNNDLMVHMVVATDARDHAVELVKHMEKSSHFRSPQVVAETVTAQGVADQAAGLGTIQFDIAAIYVPEGPDAPAEDEKPKEEPKKGPPAKSAQKTPEGGASTTAQNQRQP